jgi:hypothetical protein
MDEQLTTPSSPHSVQSQPNKPNRWEKTKETINQLLDYFASQEEGINSYKASKMILAIHSNAGYCNKKESRSQVGGHFFLTNNDEQPPNNGAILIIAIIIKAVMSSAAEAEAGALYLNAKEAVYIGQILTKIGHPQPKTSIQTNNLMAKGVINSKVQPKQTKAMDMQYHWLQDHKAQGQFRFYWKPGKTNLAD